MCYISTGKQGCEKHEKKTEGRPGSAAEQALLNLCHFSFNDLCTCSSPAGLYRNRGLQIYALPCWNNRFYCSAGASSGGTDAGFRQEKSVFRKPTDKLQLISVAALAGYLLFTLISALISPYSSVWLGGQRRDGVLTIGLYILTALFLMHSFHPTAWMLHLFGGTMVLFCVLGIIQLTGANPFHLYPEEYNFYDADRYYAGEYWSTVGNTDFCGALLSVGAGCFMAALVRRKQQSLSWLAVPLGLIVFSMVELRTEAGLVAFIAGLLLLPPLIVTGVKDLYRLLQTYGLISFCAFAGQLIHFEDGIVRLVFPTPIFLAGAVFLLLLSFLLKIHKVSGFLEKRCLRLWLAGLMVAVIIFGVLFLCFYDGFSAPFLQQAHELLHGNADPHFGSGRLYIWQNTWPLVKEHPCFGGGPDTLGLRGIEPFTRYSEELQIQIISSIDAAHNEYLNILVNQGAFSLLAYMVFLTLSLIRWCRNFREDSFAVAGAAALFYLIQAFFGISIFLTTPYLWLALATLNKNTAEKENAK